MFSVLVTLIDDGATFYLNALVPLVDLSTC